MKEANKYIVTLKDGTIREVTRMEEPGKNLIGLWAWSLKQMAPIIISFNECSVLSEYIAMIDKLEPHVEVGNRPEEQMEDDEGWSAQEAPMTLDEWERREKERLLKEEGFHQPVDGGSEE